MELKTSNWGIKVDKSKATKTRKLRGSVFPKGSGLNFNMIRIVDQTKEEKIKMYMKLPKKELIEMLIECNRILDLITKNKL